MYPFLSTGRTTPGGIRGARAAGCGTTSTGGRRGASAAGRSHRACGSWSNYGSCAKSRSRRSTRTAGWARPADTDVESKVLPYQMVEACRQAFIKGLAPAQGGHADDRGVGSRRGRGRQVRAGHRHRPADQVHRRMAGASRAICSRLPCGRMRRVCSMACSGSTTTPAARYAPSSSRLGASYPVRPVNFGGAVGGPDVRYEKGGRPPPLNKDVFARLNIQMATAVRLRMQRTMQLPARGGGRPVSVLLHRSECRSAGVPGDG